MPSRLGYIIGSVLMVVGPLAAALLVALSIANGEGARRGETRLPIPGERTLSLEDEKYIVYYEEPSSTASSDTISSPPLEIRVTPLAGGAPLPVSDYATNLTVQSGGRAGIAVATIEPPAAGSYRLSVRGAQPVPGATAVLGRPFVARLALTLAGAGLLFLVGLLTGGIIVLVTFLRRRKAKRSGVPPGPAGSGGPWPPPPGPSATGWPA